MILSVLGVSSLIVVALVLPTACASMGRRSTGKSLEKIQRDSHYRGAKFVNPVSTTMMAPGSFWRTIGAWIGGKQVREPKQPMPVVKPDPSSLEKRPASGLAVTWLGHASALIQLDERVTPVPGLGPKRFHPSPISAAEMPSLDAVIISHDHYDHLDMASIKALTAKTKLFIVPLGIGAHLRSWDVPDEKIVELGWWESKRVGKGLILVATPARHFSGRGALDRNKTLWASFALVGRKQRVYFGGDTGMFDGFTEIGERLGPFDLTLMPIGAYNENWAAIHLNPEEALAAHRAVRGKLMLPIHWGTFNLSIHSWTEPAERLMEAVRDAGADAGFKVAIPRPGERVTPKQVPSLKRWWPKVPWERAKDSSVKTGHVVQEAGSRS